MLLRVRTPLSQDQLDELVRAGATLRTNTGSVLTVDLPVMSIDDLLTHEWIEYAEVSRPLLPEKAPADEDA
jgi:hypothetical protein